MVKNIAMFRGDNESFIIQITPTLTMLELTLINLCHQYQYRERPACSPTRKLANFILYS